MAHGDHAINQGDSVVRLDNLLDGEGEIELEQVVMTPPLYIGFFRVFTLLLLDTPVSICVLLLNLNLPGIYLNLFTHY